MAVSLVVLSLLTRPKERASRSASKTRPTGQKAYSLLGGLTVGGGASAQPPRVYSPPPSPHAVTVAVPSYPSAQDATTTNWAGFSSVSSTSYPVKLAGVVQDCVQRREFGQECNGGISCCFVAS